MSALAATLPMLRPGLVIRPLGDEGRYVVKDPRTASYFHLGEEEHFLLTQLDGNRSAGSVCAAFEQRFGQTLSAEDLEEFVEMTRKQGLVVIAEGGLPIADAAPSADPLSLKPQPQFKQSILFWRKSLFDPDRFFDGLEPNIRFFWTRGFLLVSACCIVAAGIVLWANPQAILSSFAGALRWETFLLAWLVLILVTTLHEFAHGLTCKHYGGEVHEIGFLLMCFMPCFYCNVSDAWLFREKSKRLWVTFAGGYFELFLWAIGVIIWRVTMPDSLVNYLSFIVMSICGVQSLFFNFNPLIKLDGYYLLSDWLELPNLRQRSFARIAAYVRHLLWGAAKPPREDRSTLLTSFGIMSWGYSMFFLSLMLLALWHWIGRGLGVIGALGIGALAWLAFRGLFYGFIAGEVGKMISMRHIRTMAWLIGFAGVGVGPWFVSINHRVGGPCAIRSSNRVELQAPVDAFVREMCVETGARVQPGAPIARLHIPDLPSRLARGKAQVKEAEAELQLLEAGTRPEQIEAQRQRVELAQKWCELAQRDLSRSDQALKEELAALDQQIAQAKAELDQADRVRERFAALVASGAGTDAEAKEAESRYATALARREQIRAQRRECQTLGTMESEMELARRQQDLMDAQLELMLLESGSRRQEIDAARSRLVQLQEDVSYLESLEEKLEMTAPITGVVTTPRLHEKLGQYLETGALVCVIEDPDDLVAEVSVDEQDVARIALGQEVRFQPRAMPLETLHGEVLQVSPAAESGEEVGQARSVLKVTVRLDGGNPELRPGMSGHARIVTGQRVMGEVFYGKALALLRTEFWW